MKRALAMLLTAIMVVSLVALPSLAEGVNPADGCKITATIKKADAKDVVKDGVIGKDEYVEIEINRDPEKTDCLLSWAGGTQEQSKEFLQDVHFYISWDETHGLNLAIKAKLLETPENKSEQPDAGDDFVAQFGGVFCTREKNGKNDAGKDNYDTIIYRGLGMNTDTKTPLYGNWGQNGYNGEFTQTAGQDYAVSIDGNVVTYEISFPFASTIKADNLVDGKPKAGSEIYFDMSAVGGSKGIGWSDQEAYAVCIGDGGFLTSYNAIENPAEVKGIFSDDSVKAPPSDTSKVEPAIKAFQEKYVCTEHKWVHCQFIDGASLTEESLCALIKSGLGLGDGYEVTANAEEFAVLQTDFKNQGDGDSASEDVTFTVEALNNTPAFTRELKLHVRPKKKLDATEISFIDCPAAMTEITNPFKDVKKNQWFYDAVMSTYDAGLMEGIEKDVFSPDGDLTRAQMVMILSRMSGDDVTGMKTEASKYPDVGQDAWYADAIGWATKNGIVSGNDDGTFKPDKPVSREELAKLFVEFVGYMNIELVDRKPLVDKFSDASGFQNWSKDYIEEFRKMALVEGIDGAFVPGGKSSRAQIATVLSRYLDADKKVIDPMNKLVETFLDDHACVTHKKVNMVLGTASAGDYTVDNFENLVLTKLLKLDPAKYEVVANEAEFMAGEESFSGQAVGYGAEVDVSFKVVNKETKEESKTLEKVPFDLQKWTDPRGKGFQYCPEDEVMHKLVKNIDDYLKVDDAERLMLTFQTSGSRTWENFENQILKSLGLQEGIYAVYMEEADKAEFIEALSKTPNDEGKDLYDGLAHNQKMAYSLKDDKVIKFAIENTLKSKCMANEGKTKKDITAFVEYKELSLTKDITEWIIGNLPDEGGTYAFDGTLSDEAAFSEWLGKKVTVEDEKEDVMWATTLVTDFKAIQNASSSKGTIDVTATFVRPKNKMENASVAPVTTTRTYKISFAG